MSAEPTRGPWQVIAQPAELNARVIGHGGQHVATVWSGNACALEVAMANAQRIAAALELLEACEELLAHLPTLWGDHVNGGKITLTIDEDAIYAARDAIARAKGGAS